MSNCPKCNEKLSPFYMKQNCPKCGKSLFKGKGGVITCSNTDCGYSYKAPRKNAKKSQENDDE